MPAWRGRPGWRAAALTIFGTVCPPVDDCKRRHAAPGPAAQHLHARVAIHAPFRLAPGPCAHAAPVPDAKPSQFLSRSFVADAAAAAAPAVVSIVVRGYVTGGAGSGFLVDKSGLVVTNAHVVERASDGVVTVTLWDGRTLRGHCHSMDRTSDIALVQIDGQPPRGGYPAARMGTSSRLRAGDFVVALGSPLNLGRTVTAGIVSATARHASEIGMLSSRLDYIQTDAAINHGNSGGPLVNLDGEVVGICTLKIGNSDGIAFAVPIDAAWPVVKQLLRNKKVARPYVGIKMRTDPVSRTVTISAVKPGSPADRAGLAVGDRILACDGHLVGGVPDVLNRTGVSIGQHIAVEVESPDGERKTVTVITEALNS